MKTLEIYGAGGVSTIRVGESLLNLKNYISADHVVIITDSNVRDPYQKNFPPCDVITIGTGEKIKNLDTMRYI